MAAWPLALLAVLLGLAAPLARAAGEERFQQGVSAARAGDYTAAIEYFESAWLAGLDSGALHYNLGVAYYHAGRVGEAEAAFRRAARSGSMAAPARFQLGRIALERGDTARAEAHFRQVAREARTEALRRRARAALDEAPAARSEAAPPDFVYLSLGGGHDSNIALTPADASGASEESDTFLEGLLVMQSPMDDRHYLRTSLYLQGFLDQDDFDLAVLQGGLGRVGRLAGGWRWDAWLDARYQEFGGDEFERALVAGGELRGDLGPRWALEFDYRLEAARGGDGFGFLDGHGYALSATLKERGDSGWRLAAEVATTDRDDLETANDFFSFSWTRVGLDAGYRNRLRAGTDLVVGGDWARQDYDGNEVRAGVRVGGREDDRLGLEVALERRLASDWGAVLSLRFEERDSSLAEFDYDRRVLRAVVERVY